MPHAMSKTGLGESRIQRAAGGGRAGGTNTHSLLKQRDAAVGGVHKASSAATRQRHFFGGSNSRSRGPQPAAGRRTTSSSTASRSSAKPLAAGPRPSGPQRLQPKRGDDMGLSSAPAYKPTHGRHANTINRHMRRGSGDGAGSAAGSIPSMDDARADGTVLVKSAGAAEELVRAEEELSSKLRKAIRGGGGGSKGKKESASNSRGNEQVARSLAKRRQARLEIAKLRSQSAFVDWLWLGNTERPDVTYKQAVQRRKGRPAATAAPSVVKPFGEAGVQPVETHSRSQSDAAAPDATTAAAAAAAAASSSSSSSAAAADEPTPTGRSSIPQLWTAAGQTDGVVRPMRQRRASIGAEAVDKILSDFDRDAKERKRAGGGSKGVRGGGTVKPMSFGRGSSAAAAAAASSASGAAKDSTSAVASKPKNEQAPERGNVHARIAAKRRHLPDGGCARCWAITTRCCAEAWELRQARLEAARRGVVLTGRAQEAVEVLGITQTQVRRMYKSFVELDDGLEGRIHLSDFFEEFLGLPRSAVTDAIWLALVENTTGSMLSFEDFVLITCVYCMFTEEDILRFSFSTFDANGNGDLDEEEFRQMLRIVNHERPLFPGNFKQALETFDVNQDGVIGFDEFVEMHKRFPLLMWPLFQLQDRMQERSLGRPAWAKIARRDAKMRAVNQSMLRSKEEAIAAAPGLARGELNEASAAGSKAVSPLAGAVASDVRGGAASTDGAGSETAASTASTGLAPGQRLAGLAVRKTTPSSKSKKQSSSSPTKSKRSSSKRR